MQIVRVGLLIGLSSEAGQAFMIDVEPERVGARHQYVDTQVELESINEKWVLDIALDDILMSVDDIFDVAG